jgi:hypothetical protein
MEGLNSRPPGRPDWIHDLIDAITGCLTSSAGDSILESYYLPRELSRTDMDEVIIAPSWMEFTDGGPMDGERTFAPPMTWDLEMVRAVFDEVDTFVYSESVLPHFVITGKDGSGNRVKVTLCPGPVDEVDDAEPRGFIDASGRMKPPAS